MIMSSPEVRQRMQRWEGRRYVAYWDPIGKVWTNGIGHAGPDVHEGDVWDDQKIDDEFDADWAKAGNGVMTHWPWAASLNDARQFVLINMAFQLGVHGLAEFVHALTAIKIGNWEVAKREMLDSDWARETPSRADAMAEQMLTGEWQ